ncbi:hypothetical protein QFC24_001574 [Naganishia onofrii]|uniref:Uncharacterized protein n=1 Tax=Naganishia onofrii TaxID=1851511 RepID=A0ACC2XSD3_9TREE|nr:hypothetical protein QFC24_001574 [Naganishia onofrii]
MAFFQERIRIETQYAEMLQRLYAKTRAFDSLHDDVLSDFSSPLPPSRTAWREVRDHTEREAESRVAYVTALEETVFKELQEIKDRQMKIRTRIKDDLKTAESRYKESADQTVPKLKKAYFKKCQELEEQKRQDQAIAMQAKLLADPMNPGQSYSPLGASAPDQNPNTYHSPPTSTPPLPPSANPALAHIDLNDDSRAEVQSRKRAGSVGQDKAKEVLSDLATQGKKQINAFMQRFGTEKERGHAGISDDDSPPARTGPLPSHNRGTASGSSISTLAALTNREGFAYGRDNTGRDKAMALKTVKLRREAEEADKAYRNAVFNLESYRLNINKILLHANDTLSDFLGDFANRFAQILTSYVDATTATSTMNAQSSEHSRKAIRQILPTLEGLDQEGIHRISGRQSAVGVLIQSIEQDEDVFEFAEKDHDVFSISAVLKQYCRELPEPIFFFPQHERLRYTENRELHIGSNFSAVRAKLVKLPPIHQNTFRVILEHLSRVAAHADKNKMDAKNLAVIWSTALFGEDELPKDGDLTSFKPGKDTLAEDLITFVTLLFNESDVSHAPVLPPHASLTRSGSLSYEVHNERLGSSHTRAKLPFTSTSSEGKTRGSSIQVNVPPRLPPRPETLRTVSTGTDASRAAVNVPEPGPSSATTAAMDSSSAASFTTVDPSESISAVENVHEPLEDSPESSEPLSTTDVQPLAPELTDLPLGEHTK